MFWIVSIGLAGLVALAIGRALLRSRPASRADASDVAVYREQLREVERDLEKGVITQGDAETVRLEVSRRILDADRAAQAAEEYQTAPPGVSAVMGLLAAVVVIGGSALLYTRLGAPGYPDLPLARRIELAETARVNRPDQASAEAEAAANPIPAPNQDPDFEALVGRLRTTIEARPDDVDGLRLLARNEAVLGNFAAAHNAQARIITLLGDEVTAKDHVDHAELLVLAAGGYVSPEAELALTKTLEIEPWNGAARYYSGLLALQTGRPDVAFQLWRVLLETSTADAPWRPPIEAQIQDLAALAGVDYIPPAAPVPRGPTAQDVEAAGQLDPAARLEMIRSMVSGLAERLATEGGPPADWARLIRAYGVLGNSSAAAAVWAEAQQVFPDDAARVVILQAARDAGVEQ